MVIPSTAPISQPIRSSECVHYNFFHEQIIPSGDYPIDHPCWMYTHEIMSKLNFLNLAIFQQ